MKLGWLENKKENFTLKMIGHYKDKFLAKLDENS
jgi:hypothetical protein